MTTAQPSTPERTPKAARLIQALFALMFVAWIAVALVAAFSLDGAAAGIAAVAILVVGAAIGWSLRRRTLARAAERAAAAVTPRH